MKLRVQQIFAEIWWGYFPHQRVFFFRLSLPYLSLNQVYFRYVTIWLAFTLPLMERKCKGKRHLAVTRKRSKKLGDEV